ncbi:MAG: hypothetical protein HC908_05440 [Calothrix sp. SM1_7_51]|nr:hypothetical protein [Calothrix sp. SM1_7_51]
MRERKSPEDDENKEDYLFSTGYTNYLLSNFSNKASDNTVVITVATGTKCKNAVSRFHKIKR